MPFEDFDNKIKEAADQHHPDYDEKAWTKMEKLLDRHLPQKGDRRRRVIFFLLFLLLTGGGAWLVISKPWQQSNQTLSTENTPRKNEAKPSAGSAKETQEINPVTDKKNDQETIAVPVIANKKKDIKITGNAGKGKQNKDQDLIVTNGQVIDNRNKLDKVLQGQHSKTEQLTIDIVSSEKLKKDKNSTVNNPTVSSPALNSSNDKVAGDDKIKTPADLPAGYDLSKNKTIETPKENVTEQPNTADKKDIAKKSSSKKRNSFFFSFSAGPDISSIGIENPGKTKLLSGAGFGYIFRDRLAVRTGFYTGRKIYSASRYDYKPSVVPPNYNYLDNIDADCKVYEIPLNLAYNFSRSNKHSLFASAGLSSYIMKKETYVYLYKYSNGQTYQSTKTVNDENKHYFSVITLSGGYEYKINKTFSIAAEPYIKVPLAGVGYGKVKLNSAGILFSVNIRPFQSSVKK